MTSKISPKTIFSSVALVIALGSLEKSIVTTPLPMIGAELHAGAALTWVVTAYLLAATAVLPLYGKLSDLFGRVRMLNIGIGLFTSFIVSLLAIGWLLRYVSKNSFRGFAIYRIVAGIVILALTYSGFLQVSA